MKENEIRPSDLIEENERLRYKDRLKILEEKDRFVRVPCPACASEKYEAAFEKEGFQFVFCRQCEMLYVSPRPTGDMLGQYYATSQTIKHYADKIFPETEGKRRSEIFRPRADRVAELCGKHGAKQRLLIDVGAGFGTFCQEMATVNTFEKIVAVEPSHGLAEACRSKGLNVVESTIEEAGLEQADVITNFELIEHLFSPKDFLKKCHEKLSVGGLLILTTPNIKGFDLMILREKSENIVAPHHLNYFHPDAIRTLFSSCHFSVLDILTPGKLDAEIVRKKILSDGLDVGNRPFLKSILIDNWEAIGSAFQEFLMQHGLSSHLWVVARKN